MSSEPPVHVEDDMTPPPEWPSDVHPVDPNAWTAPSAPPPPALPHDWEPLDHGGREPSRGRRRRVRWGPRSLTGRLVVGVVTLVVFLVLATGIGTYFALRSFLLGRLDQQVNTTAPAVMLQLGRTRELCGGSGVPIPQTVWIAILDKTGSPTAFQPTCSDFTALALPAAARSQLVNGTTSPVSRETVTHTRIRLVAVDGFLTSGFPPAVSSQPVTVLIGLSQGDVDRTLHRLVALEWIIGSVAIALAFVVTTTGMRFTLRRLRRVTGTAHEVAAELSPDGRGLDRRVPVDESDTTEVGQLAESMNTLLAAVETQFAARLAREEQMRQFLADASHELRTPLTSIRGFAELAQMQGTRGEPEQTADNLARIEAEGTRMSRLVDDLLTLARTDGQDAQRTELVDVAELLDEAVSGVRAAYASRRIEVSAPPSLHIVGDPDQLVRVVRNLVTNAAVHTRPDGPIGVSAHREGGWLVLRVTDAGPGLPPDAAAHVFERFWRADKSRARARGGSGLGLAIVASVVEAHGGTVRFDSSVSTGSTVTVRLPLGTG